MPAQLTVCETLNCRTCCRTEMKRNECYALCAKKKPLRSALLVSGEYILQWWCGMCALGSVLSIHPAGVPSLYSEGPSRRESINPALWDIWRRIIRHRTATHQSLAGWLALSVCAAFFFVFFQNSRGCCFSSPFLGPRATRVRSFDYFFPSHFVASDIKQTHKRDYSTVYLSAWQLCDTPFTFRPRKKNRKKYRSEIE